jgi:CII-binding regulator of phage lambda lysogenization HflD
MKTNHEILSEYMGYNPPSNFTDVFKTSERTISRWISGDTEVPKWAIEIIRLNKKLDEEKTLNRASENKINSLKLHIEKYFHAKEDLLKCIQ